MKGTYARLLSFLRPYRLRLAAAVLASGVGAATVALYAYLLGPLFRALVLGQGVRLGPWTLEGKDLLWKLPLVFIGVAAVKATALFLHQGWMQGVSQHVLADLRQRLYARLLRQPPAFFDTRHSGELMSRFTSDIAQVEFAASQALSSYVKDSLTVVALLVECWLIDVRLFVLAFVFLPGAGLPVARFARSVKKTTRKTQGSLAALTQLASEHVQNLPVVQTFRGEARGMDRFAAEESRYFQAMERSLFLRGAFTPTLELLGIAGIAVVIGAGAQLVQAEPDLSTKLPSFLAAALLMYQPLKALTGTFGLTLQGVAAAERLFDITDLPEEADGATAAAPLRDAVTFDQVSFSYGAGVAALDGVTLRVPRGKTVALVGPSGSGKSTLFSLLLRFRTPSQGRIFWDGVDLTTLSCASLRDQLGWVPQEPLLFSGTIRDNLSLGRRDVPDAALWEALERAHARGFVERLGDASGTGLDARLGEGGRTLSGGQRQRLSIARAFLRSPSLLLLDEPTSALDAASEAEVHAGLQALMQGRTALVIAHRLSTVRRADWLYVLDGGRVVEEGTHDTLVQRGGVFARMVRAGELAGV